MDLDLQTTNISILFCIGSWCTYLTFFIFFTLTYFEAWKFYTQKCAYSCQTKQKVKCFAFIRNFLRSVSICENFRIFSHWIWFLDTQNTFCLMVKGLKNAYLMHFPSLHSLFRCSVCFYLKCSSSHNQRVIQRVKKHFSLSKFVSNHV